LLEVFSGFGKPMPRFHDFAFPDKFIEAGTQTELFARYQLDASGITKYIKEKILR
jgi:transketolase C-terminal domain/subunit